MATTKRTSRTRRKTTSLSVGNVVKGVQTPFTILVGMLGGSYLNKFLQKTFNPIAETVDEGTSGLSGEVVAYGIPVSLLLAGIILPNFLKFGPAGRYSKDIGTGIAVYGGFQTAKKLIGTDFLEGMKGMKGLKGTRMGVLPRTPVVRQLPANAFKVAPKTAVI